MQPRYAFIACSVLAMLARTGPAASAEVPTGDAKWAATLMFQAVRTDDAVLFDKVAPNLVIMASQNVGAPVTFADTKAALGDCALERLDDPQPGRDGQIPLMAGMLVCGGGARLDFDIMAEASQVYAIFPGALKKGEAQKKGSPAPGR